VSAAEERAKGDELAGREEGRRGDGCSLKGCILREDEHCVVFLERLCREELLFFVRVKAAQGFLSSNLRSHCIPAGLNWEVSIAGDVRAGRGRTKCSCLYLNLPKMHWIFTRFKEENKVLVVFRRKMPSF